MNPAPLEHVLDWNQLGAMTGVISAIVGVAVVYLRLFVAKEILASESRMKECFDSKFQRKGGA